MKNVKSVRNREVLLLYGFRGTEIGRQLQGVTARMGILCKVVEEDQTENTIGALLKLPGFETVQNKMPAEKQKVLDRQVMIMYGFTNQRLDMFLQNMKRAGLPVIPLKAIVTPQNAGWSFRMLYEELEKEDERVRKSKM